jgi:hypothetical protein
MTPRLPRALVFAAVLFISSLAPDSVQLAAEIRDHG